MVAVLGRYWGGTGGSKLKRIFEKSRVMFRRIEISVRLPGTVFCALSHGHGLGIRAFHGVLQKVVSVYLVAIQGVAVLGGQK